jgi:DNA-binding NtrC family response regulator
MECKILFISTPRNQTFADVLGDVLRPYGDLEVCTWQDKPDLSGYTLIILDAGIQADLEHLSTLSELLKQLFQITPQARVLVTTSSPTWKRTREALIAGAVDYIRQTLDPDSLYNNLAPTISKYCAEKHQDGE